jgi:two-component system chemotaxis response regulator CheB
MREAITAALMEEGGFDVTVAPDTASAWSEISWRRPDVILLDIEVPRQDSLGFLRRVMAADPIPVVLTAGGGDGQLILRAMAEGATAVVHRLQPLGAPGFEAGAALLVEALREASDLHVLARPAPGPPRLELAAVQLPNTEPLRRPLSDVRIVAVGTATGGTEALRAFLQAMPVDAPGMVVVHHLPGELPGALAARLNQQVPMEVREAAAGDVVRAGRVLIAPGGRHLSLERRGRELRVALRATAPVNRRRPSADVLFRSVAAAVGRRAVGIVLTGTGSDGARGLLEMKRAGALTIAQDEASSVAFGMPREAIARGGVMAVLPLQAMPEVILARARRPLAERRARRRAGARLVRRVAAPPRYRRH